MAHTISNCYLPVLALDSGAASLWCTEKVQPTVRVLEEPVLLRSGIIRANVK